jgi:hypothetical protein
MTLEGTIVNGVVILDGDTKVPEGARVRVDFAADAETFEYPHPLAPYDREKEVALLRERIANREAGGPGIPLREAMAGIAAELNLPRVDPE